MLGRGGRVWGGSYMFRFVPNYYLHMLLNLHLNVSTVFLNLFEKRVSD